MNKKKYIAIIAASLIAFYVLAFAVVPMLSAEIPKSYLLPADNINVELPSGFNKGPELPNYARNITFGRNALTVLVTVLGAAAVFLVVKAPAKQ